MTAKSLDIRPTSRSYKSAFWTFVVVHKLPALPAAPEDHLAAVWAREFHPFLVREYWLLARNADRQLQLAHALHQGVKVKNSSSI
jgi:hypothetical protein